MAMSVAYYVVQSLLIVVFCKTAKCHISEINEISTRLDTILSRTEWLGGTTKSRRRLEIWKQYGFASKLHHEEVQVTSVSIRKDSTLSEDVKNWQYVEHNDKTYLVGIAKSTLSLYEFDRDGEQLIFISNFSTIEKILTFEIISPNNPDDPNFDERGLFLLVSLASRAHTYSLQLLRLVQNKISPIWTSPMSEPVIRIRFFKHTGQKKLLLQYQDKYSIGSYSSPIEVYDFEVLSDFFEFRLCSKLLVAKISDIQICPTKKNTMLTIKSESIIALYEFENREEKKCSIKLMDEIPANGIVNSICFMSGNTLYFGNSGLASGLYEFDKGFLYDNVSDKEFDEIRESDWILNLPISTYREESLIFVQLQNSTVLSFGWQGQYFQKIPLPNQKLDHFNLADMTVIPEFGFIVSNTLIKLEVELTKKWSELGKSKANVVFEIQSVLEELLEKQDLVINQTLSEQTYSGSDTLLENFNEINGDKILLKEFNNFSVRIGERENSINRMISMLDRIDKIANKIDRQLADIDMNLNQAYWKNVSITNLQNIQISGSFDIQGTLSVDSLELDNMNGVSINDLMEENANHKNLIRGKKNFPTIEYKEDLTIERLNGIPLKNILFSEFRKDYNQSDLSKYKKLIINGNLDFLRILDYKWTDIVDKLILKNKKQFVMGDTTVIGSIHTNNIEVDYLNRLKYPQDFIISYNMDEVKVTGFKSFKTLRVANIGELQSINGIPINDFIVLNKDQTLEFPITFEDIEIDQSLVIDGKITGKVSENVHHLWTLNDTTSINSKIVFNSLSITGNIYVDNTVNGYHWSKFDDLILLDEEDAVISGHKTFLNDVEIKGQLTIINGIINGHFVNDFVTVDTDQDFPFLSKISGAVSFDNVVYDELIEMENVFNDQLRKSEFGNGLTKELIFLVSPIVDELKFDMLNGNVSSVEFHSQLGQITQNVYFENLSLGKLVTQYLISKVINGVPLREFENSRVKKNATQILSGNITIDHLESKYVQAEIINGYSMNKIDMMTKELEVYYDEILNGKKTILSLQVTGAIRTNKINNQSFRIVYKPNAIEPMELQNNTVIKNLQVDNLVNGLNFSQLMDDTVLVTDENVVVSGRKSATKITCKVLNTNFLNGKPVENILNVKKHQILTGPLKVKGSVIVQDVFHSEGKIGQAVYKTLPKIIETSKDDTYKLQGSFRFGKNVQINNLIVEKKIQSKFVQDFFSNVIFVNDTQISVTGNKNFTQSVVFLKEVVLLEKFNHVDLKRFYERAIFINRPIEIPFKTVFTQNIIIEKQLYVRKNLEASSINGVDVNDLRSKAIYTDERFNNEGIITFMNVVFNSDVIVKMFNGTNVNELITMNTDQILPITLECMNLIVDRLEVQGFFNGENITDIYENTFSVFEDQNINGRITFQDHVFTRDYDSKNINNVDITRSISLVDNRPINGSFIFENAIFNSNIRLTGNLNNLDPLKWPENAVIANSSINQVITGNWTIHGSVRFEDGNFNNVYIDGLNIQQLSTSLGKEKFESEIITPLKKESEKVCLKVNHLKEVEENKIYKFKDFEYFEVINFDDKINSVHYYNNDETNFLLINFETCYLDILKFVNNTFERVGISLYFGRIDRWLTLNFQNTLYFLTLGKIACGRSAGNLWMLEKNNIKHILDLGNVNDFIKLDNDAFGILTDHHIQKWSLKNIVKKEYFPISSFVNPADDSKKFLFNGDQVLLASRTSIYNFPSDTTLNIEKRKNSFGTNEILNITAGISQTNFFLVYDKLISKDHTFVSINDISQGKILQTIPTKEPSSLLALNFDGFKETLLIFIEHGNNIQVFEYKGIQGFQRRTNIVMKAEKLIPFELDLHSSNVKKKYLAVVYKNKLSILQAEMHGERLRASTSSYCNVN